MVVDTVSGRLLIRDPTREARDGRPSRLHQGGRARRGDYTGSRQRY